MRLDLNLLVVLDAVLRHRSVSRAAEELSLSQPAVSHALNRLRSRLQDPLFLRSSGGLVPTPRALALATALADIVGTAHSLMLPDQFDPASTTLCVRLAASDYALSAVLPAALGLVERKAPGLSIAVEQAGPATLDRLASGLVDLSFWGTTPPPAPFIHAPLFREHYVGVARADHPILRAGPGAVALDGYLAARHAVVSFGDPGASAIDAALAQLGLARRVVLTSPGFSGNLAAVRATGLVASLPSRLARDLGPGLVRFDLPFAVPPYDYGLIWHPRTDAALSHRWLRQVLVSASGADEKVDGV